MSDTIVSYLSMLRTTSMLDEAMNPPVLAIISTLQAKLPAYHCKITRRFTRNLARKLLVKIKNLITFQQEGGHVTRMAMVYYYWIPLRCKIFRGILHRDPIKLCSHWRGVLLNFISDFYFWPTWIVHLQMVSIGSVMKQVIESARARW